MTAERPLIVVEDDAGFARTLKRSFERRGYDVAEAEVTLDARPTSIKTLEWERIHQT